MKLPFFILISLFIFSCSKEKQISKQITGEWKPVSLRINEKNGIAEYVDVTGNLTIKSDTKKANHGTYIIQLNFEYNGQNKSLNEIGTYNIVENDFFRTTDSLIKNKAIVNYINKEDLEFEIPNLSNKRFLFLFKKNN